MNISLPFIRRPIATSLLAVGVLVAGFTAYRLLPVAPLPRVDFPTINVQGALPGADPETMASAVATPLERRFGRIAAVSEITSVSTLGSTSIALQFDLDRNVDAAARDVQAAINAAGGDLPHNLPQLPSYRKVNPADSPIMILALTSPTIPLGQIYEAATTIVAQKISQVEGVGQVQVGGGQTPAVRVQVDPQALSGLGLSLEDVRTALATATANSPKGELSGAAQSEVVAADDQTFDAASYRNLILGTSGNGVIRLGDVAKVIPSVENNRLAAWFDDQRAILLIVRRQPGANIIEVIERIKGLLPQLRASISPAIALDIASDRSTTIRASVDDVRATLLLTIGLVILVVFLFLRSGWATAIPSLAVPLSLVGTFGAMYLLDYSLDNLSLMALTISTGFVVDDAIVMLENIQRYLEQGDSPMTAALKGARQIGFTIVSITVSLLAVFIPILLMGGIIGRLFREFAVTLSVAVAISALVSLTVTPMMASRFLKSPKGQTHGSLYLALERGFDGLLHFYERTLVWALRHRRAVLLIAVATLGLTVFLFVVIPKGFFPQQDTGLLTGFSDAPQDISFQTMLKRQQALNAVVLTDPDVEHLVSFIGTSPGTAGNTGTQFIQLKPRKQRSGSADDIVHRLLPKLARVEGITDYLQSVQDVRLGGRATRTQYQYTLQDSNLEELSRWAPRLLKKLQSLPALQGVASDQQTSGLAESLKIDRDTAGRLGIQPRQIDDTLYDAFGQRPVATLYSQTNQYHVVMEVDPRYQQNPDALASIYVRAPAGNLVPLSAFVQFQPAATSLSLGHQGQFPAVTLSFNLSPGVALGDAVDAINAAATQIGLPPTVQGSFQGTAQAFQASLASEPLLILAALLAVYIVLGVLYESLIHPITILSTLPAAGVGALLTLMIFRVQFDIIGLVGILLLIGIVKKNAIMMIDFALEAERDEGLDPEESIFKACLLRFRPILMTTAAAFFGALPLALGGGTGSELRRPLGLAIVGGLLFSQLLTLYTTPVIYLALERLASRGKKRGRIGPRLDIESAGRPATPGLG
jgi:hydrophobe/amphiphile efflux-1 (HAE1) family protein